MRILGLFIISCALGFSANVYSASNINYEHISVNQAQQIIQQNQQNTQFELIDVRTDKEYRQGHIKGARKIDFYTADFSQKLQALDRDKLYLVYCRSGNRSSKTLNIMQRLGFKNVYNMQGGIMDWYQQNKPLQIEN